MPIAHPDKPRRAPFCDLRFRQSFGLAFRQARSRESEGEESERGG